MASTQRSVVRISSSTVETSHLSTTTSRVRAMYHGVDGGFQSISYLGKTVLYEELDAVEVSDLILQFMRACTFGRSIQVILDC